MPFTEVFSLYFSFLPFTPPLLSCFQYNLFFLFHVSPQYSSFLFYNKSVAFFLPRTTNYRQLSSMPVPLFHLFFITCILLFLVPLFHHSFSFHPSLLDLLSKHFVQTPHGLDWHPFTYTQSIFSSHALMSIQLFLCI